MAEVHQAPAGGKGGDLPSALRRLRHFVEAAHALRDGWSAELEGPTYPRTLPTLSGLAQELHAWLAEAEAAAERRAGDVPALDLTDREIARAWLADLRAQIDDVMAAGEDATRPPGRRALGRAVARNAITEGRHALTRLLAAAERGLALTPDE